jgi:aspartyl protease family protein
MQMTYLLLLGLAIGGSAIVAGRKNMGKMAQQAAIWVLIFIGVIGAYGLWEDIGRDVSARQTVMDDGQIAVPRNGDGHYYLTLDINNVPIRFVVDTGASQIVLTQDDARRIGIDPSSLNYLGSASTANGVVRTAPVMLDTVALEDTRDTGLPAVVNGGAMQDSLLGMTYLGLYKRLEIANGDLVRTR